MRWLLIASLLLLLPSASWATARVCTAGGTLASPHGWATAGTWNPDATPTTSDTLDLSAACVVECPYGVTCSAASVTVTNAAAELVVQEGGILVLDNQDDFDDPNFITAGTVMLSGAKLWDTTDPAQGAIWSASNQVTTSAAKMQMFTSGPVAWATPGATVPAVGDFILVTSGVGSGLWYEITAISFSGCPTVGATCSITFQVYDDAMAYGNVGGAGQGVGSAHDTTNRAINVYIGDGTATGIKGERARVAAPNDAKYSTAVAPNGEPTPFDRCVDLCFTDALSGWAGDCVTSTVLAENGSYVGWILDIQSSSATPGGGTNTIERHLITKSFNDINCALNDCISGSAAGTVDRVCSDASFGPSVTGTATQLRNVAIEPPIHAGVDFQIWKMATVRNTGAENDAVLSITGSGSLVADGGYFDDIADLNTDSSGLFDLDHILFVPASTGDGVSGTQHDCRDGRTIRVLPGQTGAYDLDWVSVQDARVPIDNSATCCIDGDLNGSCDAPGTPADNETTSGQHGIQLKASPPAGTVITHIACRYMTDDCYFGEDFTVPGTIDTAGVTIWQGAVGTSTESIEFVAGATEALTTSFSDVVAINSSGGGGGAVNVETLGGAITTHISGVYSNQSVTSGTINLQAVEVVGASNDSSASDIIALSAIPTANTDPSVYIPKSTRVFARNLGKVTGAGWNDISRIYVSLASNAVAAFGQAKSGTAAKLHDFVILDADLATMTPSDPGSGATLEVYDGYLHFTTPGVLNGIANFANASIPLGPHGISGIVVYNAKLLACGTIWGPTNDDLIQNIIGVRPGTSDVIASVNCPNSGVPRIISAYTLNQSLHPFTRAYDTSVYGPQHEVGVPSNAPIMLRVFDGLVAPSYSATLSGGGGSGTGGNWGGFRWPEH